jgi:hypothetical protein
LCGSIRVLVGVSLFETDIDRTDGQTDTNEGGDTGQEKKRREREGEGETTTRKGEKTAKQAMHANALVVPDVVEVVGEVPGVEVRHGAHVRAVLWWGLVGWLIS